MPDSSSRVSKRSTLAGGWLLTEIERLDANKVATWQNMISGTHNWHDGTFYTGFPEKLKELEVFHNVITHGGYVRQYIGEQEVIPLIDFNAAGWTSKTQFKCRNEGLQADGSTIASRHKATAKRVPVSEASTSSANLQLKTRFPETPEASSRSPAEGSTAPHFGVRLPASNLFRSGCQHFQ